MRTKVENQRLLDDNENLRLRLVELEEKVASQPAEVERGLRQEMERVMQRNIEVQNQNRHYEEEREESDRLLVQAKLGQAEVSLFIEGCLSSVWQASIDRGVLIWTERQTRRGTRSSRSGITCSNS